MELPLLVSIQTDYSIYRVRDLRIVLCVIKPVNSYICNRIRNKPYQI